MSKIICDVCGTAYPETSSHCPICGCAQSPNAQQAAADTVSEAGENALGYSYVKGGRFSKKNVKKRSQHGSSAPERRNNSSRNPDSGEDPTNVGLIVVVVLLLLAIIAVVIYIAVNFFRTDSTPAPDPESTSQVQPSDSTTAEDPTESVPDAVKVPCTGMNLSVTTIEFLASGDSWTLSAKTEPSNTTEAVVYQSSDEKIVKVDKDGKLTAVGTGEAVVTATCGSQKAECKVFCRFDGGADATDPEKPTDPPKDELVFEFNTRWVDETTGKADCTLGKKGEKWRAYKSDMNYKPEDIVWTTDDEAVCTIEKGMVTAVAPGKTEIHAQVNGKTYTCVIRCNFKEAD